MTLIELILSMVIVALVFATLPKIFFVANRGVETQIKEEALYNAVALMGLIVRLPWDENNTDADAVLQTDGTEYRCDPTVGYRVGGFKGSRNCFEVLNASAIGPEESEPDDLDDYDGYVVDTTTPQGAKFTLKVKVDYLQNPPAPTAESVTVDLGALGVSTRRSDIKEVNVTVTYAAAARKGVFTKSLYYDSANLGRFYLYKRAW